MYFLINRDDIVRTVTTRMLIKLLAKQTCVWRHCKKMQSQINRRRVDPKTVTRRDWYQRAELDLKIWTEQVRNQYKTFYKTMYQWVDKNYEDLLPFFNTHNKLVKNFLKSSHSQGLIKAVGPQLDSHGIWITKHNVRDHREPILVRNIVNNEELLSELLQNQSEFWFIDTGYTNFLNPGRKVWHRLVHNHIHSCASGRYFPADRLELLPSFPRPWRNGGQKILVVESSESHYSLFGTTLKKWRKQVQTQLEQHTDRPVEFRVKELNKKIRTNLYQQLQNEDYYCVISDSSAAAIEAIWCGIPVITLGQHITNSVARSSIKDIDNLYRGPIGDWLCELTYSQWTSEELANGTAIKLLGEYCHV